MFGKVNLLLSAGILVCLVCLGGSFLFQRDYSEPNYEWVPERQMARSPAVGSYAANHDHFPDGVTFRQPAHGTIPQGWQAFNYRDSEDADVRAGDKLKNPLSAGSPQVLKHGAQIYAAYCQVCHGEKGNGKGIFSERDLPIFTFLDDQAKDMTEGRMFDIITHGKNNMPAHAVQLSPKDRWSVIRHIRALQDRVYPRVSVAQTIKTYQDNCVACHGQDGSGNHYRTTTRAVPDFTSQIWQRSKSRLEMANRIEYGDQPDMPAFGYKLTRDQILGLTIYLRTFARKESDPAPKKAPDVIVAGLNEKQIFRDHCMACHNPNGKGATARPGMPDIPDFTLVGWHKTKMNAELSKAILNGGKFMPAMKDKGLSPADADRMAQFVRNFQDPKFLVELESPVIPKVTGPDTPPKLDAKGKPTPTPTSPELAQQMRTASVLFRQFCYTCHGLDGKGVAAFRATTMPTLPDFTTASFRDKHTDPQLLFSILDGKPGTAMPANRIYFDEAKARTLVVYVRNFGPAGGESPSLPANEFDSQFDQLQRQWEALERDIRALKKPSGP